MNNEPCFDDTSTRLQSEHNAEVTDLLVTKSCAESFDEDVPLSAKQSRYKPSDILHVSSKVTFHYCNKTESFCSTRKHAHCWNWTKVLAPGFGNLPHLCLQQIIECLQLNETISLGLMCRHESPCCSISLIRMYSFNIGESLGKQQQCCEKASVILTLGFLPPFLQEIYYFPFILTKRYRNLKQCKSDCFSVLSKVFYGCMIKNALVGYI